MHESGTLDQLPFTLNDRDNRILAGWTSQSVLEPWRSEPLEPTVTVVAPAVSQKPLNPGLLTDPEFVSITIGPGDDPFDPDGIVLDDDDDDEYASFNFVDPGVDDFQDYIDELSQF